MKKLIVFTLVCLFFSVKMFAQSPIGKWETVDDVTGKKKSVVEIFETGGKMYGKILKLYREPGEDQDPVCDKCTGSLHNHRIIGMMILTDMKKNGTSWSGGKILDPKNGKTYSCSFSLESANKLKVRGYIGMEAIGRTQNWTRVQ